MIDIEEAFDTKIQDDPKLLKRIATWLRYREDLKYHADIIAKLNNVSTFADVFTAIRPLYDCTDCALLVNMCKQFMSGATQEVLMLESHHEKTKEFRQSTTVQQLKDDLEKIYRPHLATHFKHMPKIVVKLHNEWLDVKEEILYRFIRKLLPIKSSQSLIDYIEIIPGSVTIIYYVQDCTADMLREHLQTKLKFMHLTGIFSLYINDHPVLQEDENMNFTFELALLEAVTAGNNEAVEFLLQLETVNIDRANEEGKTALTLACEKGQEDVVHSLLSAGANDNIQDKNGQSSLGNSKDIIKNASAAGTLHQSTEDQTQYDNETDIRPSLPSPSPVSFGSRVSIGALTFAILAIIIVIIVMLNQNIPITLLSKISPQQLPSFFSGNNYCYNYFYVYHAGLLTQHPIMFIIVIMPESAFPKINESSLISILAQFLPVALA